MTITKEMQTIIERINNTPPQIFLTNDLDQNGLTPMCRLAKDLKSLLDLACQQHPQYQGEQQFSKGLDMASIIFLLNVIKEFLSKGKKLEISPILNDENFMISLKDGEISLQIDVVLNQNGVRLISAEVKDADGTIILNLKTDITWYPNRTVYSIIEIRDENTEMIIVFSYGGTYSNFEFSDNNQSTISLSFDGVTPCFKTIKTKCGGLTVRHTEKILPNSILETVIPNGYIPEKMLPSDLETILCNVFPEVWNKATYLYEAYYKPRSKE